MSATMRINDEDFRELNRSMGRLAKATGQTVREIIPAQARLLAVDLNYYTIPIGRNNPAKQRANIDRFVKAVYPSKSTIFRELHVTTGDINIANAFWEAINNRRIAKAQKIIDAHIPNLRIGMFDGGALHEVMRTQKKLTKRILVTAYSKVQAYSKRKQRTVGRAKSGWAAAANGLGGTRGIPAWARRRMDEGSGTVSGSDDNLTVVIQNNVPYIDEIIDITSGYSRAINYRKRVIEQAIKAKLDRETRQIKRKIANVQKVFR
jgi:hypothetical protein